MFRIEFTPEAIEDLASLRKYDQQRVLSAIEVHLAHEPGRETRRRKPLRPNPLAEWELRIDAFRVFYDVRAGEPEDAGDGTVRVIAVGWKDGNTLFVHGEEFSL